MTEKQLIQGITMNYMAEGATYGPNTVATAVWPGPGVHISGATIIQFGCGPYEYELEQDESVSPIGGVIGQSTVDKPWECACVMMSKALAAGIGG